ncbi:MAG: glycosyltransferase [Chloroflexota bacterium]
MNLMKEIDRSTNRVNNGDLNTYITEKLAAFPVSAPVIVVPVFNAYEDVVECIDSLVSNTSKDVPLLVLDDASTDNRIQEVVEPLSDSCGFIYARKAINSGFVGTMNVAFHVSSPRDVIIVNSDVVVPPNWLERLQNAAYYRTTIATATPLTNNGTILSIPYRNNPIHYIVNGMTTTQADQIIQEASLQLYPIIPTAIGHCTYFKRSALDRVGYFDEIFAPGYGEEVDFSQRAIMAGLCHVVADNLFVFHKGSRSFNARGEEQKRHIQQEHERIVAERYPWYHKWVTQIQNDAYNPLALAVERAKGALIGYHIAIDATYIDGSTTGTQVLTLELIHELSKMLKNTASLSVIVADNLSLKNLLGIDTFVDRIYSITEVKQHSQPIFDLIHRPFQVRTKQDLELLQQVARRVVISHLDCIALANPSYASTAEDWMAYRQLSHHTFASVDGVMFISEDAAQDAQHQGLCIDAERTTVSYVGIDHKLYTGTAKRPSDSEPFQDTPFILVFGTNFRHKSRVYALQLFQALIQTYQWHGQLVIAGPNVANGGSAAEEAIERLNNIELQKRTHYIGAVSEDEKQWLFKHAAVVLYPSNYEGFGLVPFEAAVANTPTLTARVTSLNEVLGDQVQYLETLNPSENVDILWSMISDRNIAQRQVAAIQNRATKFTWRKVASTTWDFYQQLLQLPPRRQKLEQFVTDTQPAQEHAVPTPQHTQGTSNNTNRIRIWQGRIVRMAKLFRTEGFGAVQERIRQYLLRRLIKSTHS